MVYNVQDEKYLTYDQLNTIIAVQNMWNKLSHWFSLYVNAFIYDTPNLKTVSNTLTSLPWEVYNLFNIFYGPIVAEEFKDIIFSFFKTGMEVTESIKYGDDVLRNSRMIKWYQTADKLATFLARINVYWDANQWQHMLYEYIKIKADGISAIKDGDYEKELELYKELENINALLATYMARGIIASNLEKVPTNNCIIR